MLCRTPARSPRFARTRAWAHGGVRLGGGAEARLAAWGRRAGAESASARTAGWTRGGGHGGLWRYDRAKYDAGGSGRAARQNYCFGGSNAWVVFKTAWSGTARDRT